MVSRVRTESNNLTSRSDDNLHIVASATSFFEGYLDVVVVLHLDQILVLVDVAQSDAALGNRRAACNGADLRYDFGDEFAIGDGGEDDLREAILAVVNDDLDHIRALSVARRLSCSRLAR